jgi:DNA-directed RNA polymerase subunit L
MKKTARLEIRLHQEDKDLLLQVAEKEDCTLTNLLQDHIQELIDRLRRSRNSNKPLDSEK